MGLTEYPVGWQELDEQESTIAYFIAGGIYTLDRDTGASRGDMVTVWQGTQEIVDGEERIVINDTEAPEDAQYVIEVDPVDQDVKKYYESSAKDALDRAMELMETMPWSY